jgi:hypothetical protein
MALQTLYPDTQPVAVAGAQATQIAGIHISRTVAVAAVPFGRAVTQGAVAHTVELFGSGDTTFVGISLLDRSASGLTVVAGQVTGQTDNAFGVGETALILPVGCGGDVWVVCATGCSAGDGVFVRPSNGDFQDSNANSAVQIPGARWDTDAATGAFAIVRMA